MRGRISLRPSQDDDGEFLLRLYASTRAEELALAPWSQEEKERFVQMQFDMQRQHYRTYYPDARFEIVMLEDQPVGRLYTDRRAEEIWVVDIALLREWRGQGIGGELMNGVLAEAAAADKPVRLHVLQNNPAIGLYRRLGFKKTGESGMHDLMEWRAS